MAAAFQPEVSQERIERHQRGFGTDFQMNPEARSIGTLDREMERILLAFDVVLATGLEVVHHPLFGVHFTT